MSQEDFYKNVYKDEQDFKEFNNDQKDKRDAMTKTQGDNKKINIDTKQLFQYLNFNPNSNFLKKYRADANPNLAEKTMRDKVLEFYRMVLNSVFDQAVYPIARQIVAFKQTDLLCEHRNQENLCRFLLGRNFETLPLTYALNMLDFVETRPKFETFNKVVRLTSQQFFWEERLYRCKIDLIDKELVIQEGCCFHQDTLQNIEEISNNKVELNILAWQIGAYILCIYINVNSRIDGSQVQPMSSLYKKIDDEELKGKIAKGKLPLDQLLQSINQV